MTRFPELRSQDEFQARCTFDALDEAGDRFIEWVEAIEIIVKWFTMVWLIRCWVIFIALPIMAIV